VIMPIHPKDIQITDPFWSYWRKLLLDKTLLQQYEQLQSTGRIENFRRAARGEHGTFEGLFFNDSDVYKWIEACAYVLHDAAYKPPALMEAIDATVNAIVDAQEDDGYLNTFFQVQHPALKWRNLGAMHEMYCAGHLFEAAAAMKENLDDSRLLEVAVRFAEHILQRFGPAKRLGYCGHEEVEIGLIRLAAVTGNQDYRAAAKWMIEQRGHRPSPFELELQDAESMILSPWAHDQYCDAEGYKGEYMQDHAPIREHTEVVGHAVRAMYLYIAAAATCDDPALAEALRRTWLNLTGKRMYITGGIGPSSKNEGFTTDYDLPNLSAYAETCASIGLALWGTALADLFHDAEYVDVVERALYNGALSGISVDGCHYFYTNPLESRAGHSRTPWFRCACCPPNIARMIGSIGRFLFSVDADDLFINIPAGFQARLEVRDVPIVVAVESDYPWSGIARITVTAQEPVQFALHIRIPDWAEDATLHLIGREEVAEYVSGYAVYRRIWHNDQIELELSMSPNFVVANPLILDDIGRVAIMRGPLVYCAEQQDNSDVPQRLAVDLSNSLEEIDRGDLFPGAKGITIAGTAIAQDGDPSLYRAHEESKANAATTSLIPYFLWNNRGPSHMQVWLRTQ
jgi:DUF1680 family protein